MPSKAYPSISVVIPTYEGESILKEILPKQVEMISKYKGLYEILVVDDKSTDSSVSWLRKNFPQVNVVEMEKHQGFGAACNMGASQAKNEILFLINNDMEVTVETFEKAVCAFKDRSLFGIRLGIMMLIHKEDPIDLKEFGLGLVFKKGFFELPMLRLNSEKGEREVPALSGGACAIRKEYFDELNGFDPLFLPAYWEDVDLSFHAWQRGWKILFEPEAICYHHSSQTTKKVFTPVEIKTMSESHRYLLVWTYLSGVRLWFVHGAYLFLRLLGALFTGKGYRLKAVYRAICSLKRVREKRKKLKENSKVLFADILNKWSVFSREHLLYFD